MFKTVQRQQNNNMYINLRIIPHFHLSELSINHILLIGTFRVIFSSFIDVHENEARFAEADNLMGNTNLLRPDNS